MQQGGDMKTTFDRFCKGLKEVGRKGDLLDVDEVFIM